MPDMPPLPSRIRRLPLDHRGFPVPWFVAWYKDGEPCDPRDGEPDFRVVDTRKFDLALRVPRCWICGEHMGRHRVFCIGPMCSINRIISEPPSHRECAEFAVQACPFMLRPRMRRNEVKLPDQYDQAGGFHIERNPGVTCLWECREYKPFRAPHGHSGILFSLGDPQRTDWYREGRKATRAEVMESIETGYPTLERLARMEGREAVAEIARAAWRAMAHIPVN